MPDDYTRLEAGMVLTIEPGMLYAPGKMLVHEENLVIRDGGAELLSRRAPREIPIIS
jgi:Xaa-Pro aminopeptidase